MAAANTNLSSQLEALRHTNAQQLRTAQHDKDALSAYTTVIEEHRDTLASRCTQLQAERDRLAQQCGELKADVARVAVLTAENGELRTKIKLVSTENQLRMAQIKEDRARDAEILAKVEQEAVAWQLKWVEEAKMNFKREGNNNDNQRQWDLPDLEDHDNNC